MSKEKTKTPYHEDDEAVYKDKPASRPFTKKRLFFSLLTTYLLLAGCMALFGVIAGSIGAAVLADFGFSPLSMTQVVNLSALGAALILPFPILYSDFMESADAVTKNILPSFNKEDGLSKEKRKQQVSWVGLLRLFVVGAAYSLVGAASLGFTNPMQLTFVAVLPAVAFVTVFTPFVVISLIMAAKVHYDQHKQGWREDVDLLLDESHVPVPMLKSAETPNSIPQRVLHAYNKFEAGLRHDIDQVCGVIIPPTIPSGMCSKNKQQA